MTSHFIICPCDKRIINSLASRSVVPRVRSMEEVTEAARLVHEAKAHLHCIIVDSNRQLSFSSFSNDLGTLPIALFVSGIGNLAHVIRQVENIKKLNVRVYIPGDKPENFSAIRILSSLGVETAVVFDTNVDWDRLNDLMSYAVYGQVPHADIAPFDYMVKRYNRTDRNDFSAVYFDDYATYLHVNEFGQVALSNKDLLDGRYVCESVANIDTVEEQPGYLERSNMWKKHLLNYDDCSCCPGWRICLGKYNSLDNAQCRAFFDDFLGAVEFAKQRNDEQLRLWQP